MADSSTHLDQLSTSTANNELRVNETADALTEANVRFKPVLVHHFV